MCEFYQDIQNGPRRSRRVQEFKYRESIPLPSDSGGKLVGRYGKRLILPGWSAMIFLGRLPDW